MQQSRGIAEVMAARPEDILWHRFVAGGFGDASAACFSHPADVLKVRLQLTGEGDPAKRTITAKDFGRAARKLVIEEGVRDGLYGGISASVVRQLSFSSLRHGLCGVFERKWSGLREDSSCISPLARLGCASAAGFIAAMVANPTDVVLIRMQADGHWLRARRREYKHVFDGLARIIRDEGLSTLWRGCGPTATRAVLITAAQVVTYSEAKSAFSRAGVPEGTKLQLAAAMTSATVSCIATNPVDIVKTRIMNMHTSQGVSYSGALDCTMQTLRIEGPLAFYKGLSATFLRLWPHTVILWVSQEKYLYWLRAWSSC